MTVKIQLEMAGLRRNNTQNEQTGCLGYVRDYTTQLYGDYNLNQNKDPY